MYINAYLFVCKYTKKNTNWQQYFPVFIICTTFSSFEHKGFNLY